MSQPTIRPIRVVLVDDHALFRAGIAWGLRDDRGIRVVGEADHATAALQVVASARPDVIVIDAHLVGLTGYTVARLIRRRFPGVSVILLAMPPDDFACACAAEAGASACVEKGISPSDLAAVIREAAAAPPAGDERVRRAGRRAAQRLPGSPWAHGRECPLTNRELEVLDALVRGLTNQAIARSMVLSEQTVKNQVASVMRKLHVHDRTTAIMVALQRGWATLGDEAAPSA